MSGALFHFHFTKENKPSEFELALVMDFDQKYFPYPWAPSSWQEPLEGHLLTLLIDDGKLQGFSLWQKLHLEELSHLQKIVVSPDLRGKNIGSLLLDESEKELQKIGMKRFFLEVRTDNEVAIGLYKKQGYQELAFIKNYYSDGGHAKTFEKRVQD